jgi:hypothetical protein
MDGRNKYREVRAGGEKRVERRRSGAKCPKGKPEFKYLPRRLAGRRPPPSRPVEPASPVRGRHVSERLAPPGLTSTQQALGGHAEAGRPRERHADCGDRAVRGPSRAGRGPRVSARSAAPLLAWLRLRLRAGRGSRSHSRVATCRAPAPAGWPPPRRKRLEHHALASAVRRAQGATQSGSAILRAGPAARQAAFLSD